MRGPRENGVSTSLRSVASAAARARYPAGKAFGRIKYFEAQRGTRPAERKGGAVVQKAKAKARRANYQAAANKKRSLTPAFADTIALPAWQPLGPIDIPNGQTYGSGAGSRPAVAGRCAGVVVDPADSNHITLCSGGGGLWSSADRGKTWRALTDDQPTLSMGAVAIAPGAPHIVYAGTGEGDNLSPQGLGLLRSSDAGLTWTHVPSDALAGAAVYDLAVDPDDALHVLVATTDGLFDTDDGGETCRRRIAATTWDLSIHPTNPAEVYAATRNGLRRSDDGGKTWSDVSLPNVADGAFERMEVCHAPANPSIVFVAAVDADSVAHLWRKGTPQGAFASQAIPSELSVKKNLEQAWYDWCLGSAPDDADLLYWGVIELFRGKRSASGTWRWSKISSRNSGDSIHPDQHHIAFDPQDPGVVYSCNDGGLFRSPDRGDSWESLNPGLSITEFEFLAHLEADPVWVIGGTQDNGTLANAPALHWDQIALGDGGDCGADEDNGFCYHSFYGIWIERGNAVTAPRFRWRDVSPPAPEDYDALFYPPMDVRGALVAKAGVSVFVSDDSGLHWSEIALPDAALGDGSADKASALTFATAKRLFAGTVAGRIFRIDRPASGWANAAPAELTSPRAGFVSDIVPIGGALWASVSTFRGAHVFFSDDGGDNWENRSGNLPDAPVNALIVDPDDTDRVFAATDIGVYQTLDAGATWTSYSNGLPNAIVGDLILHQATRSLRCGTRSRGAWQVPI